MSKLISVLMTCLALLSTIAVSQTNNDKAKGEFFKAEAKFNSGYYSTAIEHLNKAIGYLGKTNARIQYMKTNCYYKKSDYQQAKKECRLFFKSNPDQNSEMYKEMLFLSEDFDKKIIAQRKKDEETAKLALEKKEKEARLALEKKKRDEADNSFWVKTKNKGTIEAYAAYIQLYPEGIYKKEAQNKIDDNDWNKASSADTFEAYQSYLKKHPRGKNSSKARTIVNKELDIRENPNEYLFQAINNKDLATLKKLVSYGASANYVEEDEWKYFDDYTTPLRVALKAENLDYEIIDYLMSKNANTNVIISKYYGEYPWNAYILKDKYYGDFEEKDFLRMQKIMKLMIDKYNIRPYMFSSVYISIYKLYKYYGKCDLDLFEVFLKMGIPASKIYEKAKKNNDKELKKLIKQYK